MELRGGGRSGLTLWQCLLWERPDHLPGRVCMFLCMCARRHAWKKEKSFVHAILHIACCVCICVFFTSISVIDTIKQRKAGGPVLWNNVPSAVWPPAQLLRCRVRRTSDTLKTKYFLRVHVFCCVCLILMACALRFMHARMWNVLLYHFRW